MDRNRRLLVKGALGIGAAGAVLSSGLIPVSAFAAASAQSWPKKQFELEGVDKTIDALYGQSAEESDKIDLQTPTIAQNGAVVPVTVTSSLPKVTSIALLVAKNPSTLACKYELSERAQAHVASRLKMAKTSDVIALVVSDGKLYRTSRNVKVTVGGCGG